MKWQIMCSSICHLSGSGFLSRSCPPSASVFHKSTFWQNFSIWQDLLIDLHISLRDIEHCWSVVCVPAQHAHAPFIQRNFGERHEFHVTASFMADKWLRRCLKSFANYSVSCLPAADLTWIPNGVENMKGWWRTRSGVIVSVGSRQLQHYLLVYGFQYLVLWLV